MLARAAPMLARRWACRSFASQQGEGNLTNDQMLADANTIFRSSLAAADPRQGIKRALRLSEDGATLTVSSIINQHELRMGDYDRVMLLGAGKAAAQMAEAVEGVLQHCDKFDGGLVVTKYDHAEGTRLNKVRTLEAAHPVPDAAGAAASREILELAQAADSRTLVIMCISGGGSALLTLPAAGLSMEDLQATNGALLACGARIEEMNVVRKHLSAIR